MGFINLCLRLHLGFFDCFVHNFLGFCLRVFQLGFVADFQLFSSSFGLGSAVQVVFNTSFAVVEYFEYRLVAEMAKNSTENNKVDDLNQQCTIQFYQFVPSFKAIP